VHWIIGSPVLIAIVVCWCDVTRQLREMEAAVSVVGSVITDDQVNKLTLTHFENLQVNDPKIIINFKIFYLFFDLCCVGMRFVKLILYCNNGIAVKIYIFKQTPAADARLWKMNSVLIQEKKWHFGSVFAAAYDM